MSMEEIIKSETDKFVNLYLNMLKENKVVINITDITDPALEVYLRAGVAQGIAIASKALLKAPVDKILPYNSEDKTKAEQLPTKEEYEESITNIITEESIISYTQYSEPKYQCPKCGGGMCRDNSKVITSYPSQYEYKCNKCGHIEYQYN